MKKLIIFTALFLIFNSTFAQVQSKLTCAIGQDFEAKNTGGLAEIKVISVHPEGVIYSVLERRDKLLSDGLILIKTDTLLNIIFRNKIVLPKLREEAKFVFCGEINNSLILLYSFYNWENNKVYLFSQYISYERLELISDAKLIYSVDVSGNNFWGTEFSINLSPDSSKILILHSTSRKYNSEAGFALYNVEDFKKIFDVNSIVQKNAKLGLLQEAKVDNEARVYICYRAFHGDRMYRDVYWADSNDPVHLLNPEFKTYIIKYEPYVSPKEYELYVENKFLYWITIQPLDSNRLLCIGLYSNPGMVSTVGSCSHILSENSPDRISMKSKFNFDLKFIRINKGKREIELINYNFPRNKDFDPYQYDPTASIKLENGVNVTIFEQRLTYISSDRYSYCNRDLLLIFTDELGNITNCLTVNRTQHIYDAEGAIGFVYFVQGDSLILVYNNSNSSYWLKPKNHKIAITTIDEKFNVNYNITDYSNRIGAIPGFNFGVFMNKNTCYLSGYNMGHQYPTLIKFNLE
jgi:hypothetical protein